MGMMEQRFRMIAAQPAPSYDGIPIFIDNAYFPKTNGTIADRVADPDWCIVGVFDTGSGSSKAYEYITAETTTESSLRLYDDLTASSVDYWGASFATGVPVVRTMSSLGRYILYSIYKPDAKNLYLKQGSTYLFKGSNVT